MAAKNANAYALAHNKSKVNHVRQSLGSSATIQMDDEETIMDFARAITMATTPEEEQME